MELGRERRLFPGPCVRPAHRRQGCAHALLAAAGGDRTNIAKAGLYADRLSRRASLIAFAICEVGIAVFAVLSPWLYYDVIYREFLPLALTAFLPVSAVWKRVGSIEGVDR